MPQRWIIAELFAAAPVATRIGMTTTGMITTGVTTITMPPGAGRV